MRTIERPRQYLAPHWLLLLRPLLRFSESRDAFVLRAVGNSRGPVLRPDRRRRARAHDGPERRRASPA